MKDRRAPVQIRPFVTSGEVWVRPDGIGFDIVPVQIFRLVNGWTALRIGRNVLYFTEDGTYDGPESSSSFEGEKADFEAHSDSCFALLGAKKSGRARTLAGWFGLQKRTNPESPWPTTYFAHCWNLWKSYGPP